MRVTAAPSSVLWSVAGTDSGGGAGLSADQRAAEALGVHLCPVVAGVTAQNTLAVTRVQALDPALLDAQCAALADDLPPRVIKLGLLGRAANAQVLAGWVDRLRAQGPVALVIDPVLQATTGARLADAGLRRAYRELLLPRATLITPNRREAAALLGREEDPEAAALPTMARALRAGGAEAVCITGGDAGGPQALDWLDSPQACGWLAAPRVATRHGHGSGCTFASGAAAAMARGFVVAEAVVLAKMLTTQALRRAGPLGGGAGPVQAAAGFAREPRLLPRLSLGEAPPVACLPGLPGARPPAPGVYAIVDRAERVEAALRGGALTVQLRLKRPPGLATPDWTAHLHAEIRRSLAAADAAGARLYINDHWQDALALGARALHLGQEDLLGLQAEDLARLAEARRRGVALGLSSHSLWELCRAAALQPDCIACGPVWPTTTKAMPWRPQGLDNLAWWAAMAPAPVVAIGGILAPSQLEDAAAAGAEGGCVVRGLGADPAQTLPAWLAAWARGRARALGPAGVPELPHPSV